MKTNKLFILFPAVFAIVLLLVSCSSVGFCQEPSEPSISQTIVFPDEGELCVDQDLFSQCPIKVRDCQGKPIKKISRKDFFQMVSKGAKVNNRIELPCNSFIADVEGNTTYYCSSRGCYYY